MDARSGPAWLVDACAPQAPSSFLVAGKWRQRGSGSGEDVVVLHLLSSDFDSFHDL